MVYEEYAIETFKTKKNYVERNSNESQSLDVVEDAKWKERKINVHTKRKEW